LALTSCGETVGTVNELPAETISASAVETSAVQTTAPEPVTTAAPETAAPPAEDVPPPEITVTGATTLEVYTDIKVSDMVSAENADILNGDEAVDTSEPGDKELTVKCSSGGAEFETKIGYTVVDTQAPVILNAGWSPEHLVGKAFDLNDYVGFADNYDRNVSLTYTGSVDPNAAGSYPITATVTDSSGNSQTWDLTINVVSSLTPYSNDGPRYDFSQFLSDYAGEGRRFGIDVSQWQGDIDFNAVRDAGCSFVMVRLGYYYSTPTVDPYFRTNIENARAAGLDVGVYYYSADYSVEGVKEHAKWVAEQLDGFQLDLPVAFDWEEFGNFQSYGMNIHDLNEMFDVFYDEMQGYGYSSMLYSSKNFLENFWTNRNDRPVWLAHYTDQTSYTGSYRMWQLSSVGNISGIYGDVDLDILYE
ncbi:MAG: glycoside hydrolase family 25, partial [Ruminococcus sp.]|nr:glycoside hydrolase family 25 [Ruminococcus sp.]